MRDAVRQVFVGELGIDIESFTDDLTYKSIPEWDSASHMVIAVALEERFNLEFESDDIVNMTSVQRIYEILQSKGIALE
ncbi:MAG: acyl carrier protein [Caulobacteraceae bacterium]